MVDAGAGLYERRKEVLASRPDQDSSAAVPAASSAMTLSDYARFAAAARFAPAQSPIWVQCWAAHGDLDIAFVAVHGPGGVCTALPLEIGRQGPFRVARFISGSHANGNFAPSIGAGSISASDVKAAVRAARPDVDLVHLERLVFEQDGLPNPLAHLAAQESPNLALAVGLEGGFDALLARTSGKRKRKKNRWQTRKFEAAGGYRRIEAGTEAEVDAVLDAFFAMKAERFRRMGVADVFADLRVQAAFRAIFKDALADPARPFVLHALEVGGRLRAVTGSSRCGSRLICDFGGISDDELASASPGEFLYFENIREACEQGYAVYDLGVGDEPYKRLWCDIETRHFDVLVPLSAKGRILAALFMARSGLKRAIKQNAFLWNVVKRLRRGSAARTAAADNDGE